MKKPSTFERYYWKLFNGLARFLGWGLIVFGFFGAATGILFFISPPEDWSQHEAVTSIIVSLVFGVTGILFQKAESYYPRHLKAWLDGKKKSDKLDS